MSAVDWWARMRGPRPGWRAVEAFMELPLAEQHRIEARGKDGLRHADPAVRDRVWRILRAAEVASWPSGAASISDHVGLELDLAVRRGCALEPGQTVPGCACERCTGIAVAPARAPTASLPAVDTRPPLPVEDARAVSILDVAATLGIVHRNGWARCPFHQDSRPSFHLNARKNAAFCNVCGRSWDGLALLMELRGLDFPDAVRELAV